MKMTFFLIFIGLFNCSVFAFDYFDKEETCLKKSDIEAIQSHFKQLKNLTGESGEKLCKGREIDEKSFEIIRTVLAIERLNLSDQIQRDENDDFTVKAIPEKDWWNYFTERAHTFFFDHPSCSTSGFVAFVYFSTDRGRIYLCPKFLKMPVAYQIETLMHEVRHFDIGGHVTCTQGVYKGKQGVCDDDIKSLGPYAASVQALVELSNVEQLSREERLLSESKAIYLLNNHFNSLPTVKSKDYIYLTNRAGEIHRTDTSDLSETQVVTSLEFPARIYSNGTKFTLFPLDTSKKAYRTSRDFKHNFRVIGAFADRYNAENEHERSLYNSINYYGLGAIAKDNRLFSFCGENAKTLTSFPFMGGAIKSVFSLKTNSEAHETYVLGESGEVYDFKCDEKKGRLSSTKVDLNLPRDTVNSFSFKKNHAFVLLESGELLSYDLINNVISTTELPFQRWLSATPLKIFRVFDSLTKETHKRLR